MGCCAAKNSRKVSFDHADTIENEPKDEESDPNGTAPDIPLNQPLDENINELHDEKASNDDDDNAVINENETLQHPDDEENDENEQLRTDEAQMNKAAQFALVDKRPDEDIKRKKSKRHDWRTGLNFDAMKHQIVFKISDATTNETYTARLGADELGKEITIDEYNKMGQVLGTGIRKYSETDDGDCKVTLSKDDIVYEFIAKCNS